MTLESVGRCHKANEGVKFATRAFKTSLGTVKLGNICSKDVEVAVCEEKKTMVKEAIFTHFPLFTSS